MRVSKPIFVGPIPSGSCGRIIFSNSMKFILACALLVAAMWCAENYDEAS